MLQYRKKRGMAGKPAYISPITLECQASYLAYSMGAIGSQNIKKSTLCACRDYRIAVVRSVVTRL